MFGRNKRFDGRLAGIGKVSINMHVSPDEVRAWLKRNAAEAASDMIEAGDDELMKFCAYILTKAQVEERMNNKSLEELADKGSVAFVKFLRANSDVEMTFMPPPKDTDTRSELMNLLVTDIMGEGSDTSTTEEEEDTPRPGDSNISDEELRKYMPSKFWKYLH